MRRVVTRAVEIAYEDTGQREPALVFIHGAFGSHKDFALVRDRLASRHRVIALDLRGHGDSGVPQDGFRIADFAQDVLAVCRDAQVERAILCGHSFAANIALTAAVQDPSLVAGVVMLDGAVLFPEQLLNQACSVLVPALEGPGWLEALRGYFGERMFVAFDPPDLKVRILNDLGSVPRHMPAPLMRDVFSHDYSDEIIAARCPLLFIHSKIPADLKRLRELRPDAMVASVIGCGHYSHMVVPDQVSAVLERFVEVWPSIVAVAA